MNFYHLSPKQFKQIVLGKGEEREGRREGGQEGDHSTLKIWWQTGHLRWVGF